MFKNYLELTKDEANKLIDFTNRNRESKLSFETLNKQLRSEEFDHGKGVIVKIVDGNILGKVLVILKECGIKGVAYIVNLDIYEHVGDDISVVGELIGKAREIAEGNGAREIYLGSGEARIIRALNKLNLYMQYSAVRMGLEDREIKQKTLTLIPLSWDNKGEYLNVYNDAFGEIPHGATLNEDEIDEYLNDINENNYYFLAEEGNEKIGFLQFEIKDNMGQFDLGLIKTARGKGYGKRLLETAICFLNSLGVKEVNLTVITKNKLAYDMYLKRGFKVIKTVSDWFILNKE